MSLPQETVTKIENYIENMNWENIKHDGVINAMGSIINQYYNNGYLSYKQVEAMRKTCIRSNRGCSDSGYLSATWHRTKKL
jgi:hypothetical protein